MPYQSNSDLPSSVRSRFSSHCQSVWRNVWNSVYDQTHDESRAYASANSQAQKCEGSKAMDGEVKFKIFAPLLKTSRSPDGKMRLHGVASSTVQDKHGDKMNLSALLDMERSAQQRMTIFLNHSYAVPEDVAGTVEHATIRPHALDPEIHDLALDILINEANPRAIQTWEAIQSGTQLGLSIGAVIPEGGATRDRRSGSYVIDHVELLETSVVGVPANPRSWVEYAVKSLNAEETKLDELLEAPADGITKFGIEAPADGTVTELVVTKESHSELPDSAFACVDSDGRHYPHHTASGAVNKALLRNALSRLGDKSNTQCGAAHIRAHARKLGIGESAEKALDLDGLEADLLEAVNDDFGVDHFELPADEFEHTDDPIDTPAAHAENANGATGYTINPEAFSDYVQSVSSGVAGGASGTYTLLPDITDARVSIKTPHVGVEIDTGNRGQKPAASSQEAHASAPETEDEDEDEQANPWAGLFPTKSDDPEIKAALDALEPSVLGTLRNSGELLVAVTRELVDTRKELAQSRADNEALEASTTEVLTKMAGLLERLSSTPLGRRAVVKEAVDEVADLRAVYDESFMNLLQRS